MVHVEPMEQFGISSRAVVIHCNLEPLWIARQRDADVALRVRLEVLAMLAETCLLLGAPHIPWAEPFLGAVQIVTF